MVDNEKKELAPLAIFVYNRLEQTKKMLAAINNNIGADRTVVFIFSDGAKSEEDALKVNEVREYVKRFAERNRFKSVHVVESECNKGLANSIISGVTEVITKYEKIIVLEDDLVTEPIFLQFMNDCLDFYKGNDRVWSIGGTTYKMNTLSKYKKSVYACYRGESWGWATWLDRWDKVDWKVSDYDRFMKDRLQQRRFKLGGQDRVESLKRQMTGKSDSWAVRWNYQEFKEGMITILPVKSLVRNIGFDGNGTHCGTDNRFPIEEIENDTFEYTLENVEVNKKIMRDFRKYFSRPLFNRILDFAAIKIKACLQKRECADTKE